MAEQVCGFKFSDSLFCTIKLKFAGEAGTRRFSQLRDTSVDVAAVWFYSHEKSDLLLQLDAAFGECPGSSGTHPTPVEVAVCRRCSWVVFLAVAASVCCSVLSTRVTVRTF